MESENEKLCMGTFFVRTVTRQGAQMSARCQDIKHDYRGYGEKGRMTIAFCFCMFHNFATCVLAIASRRGCCWRVVVVPCASSSYLSVLSHTVCLWQTLSASSSPAVDERREKLSTVKSWPVLTRSSQRTSIISSAIIALQLQAPADRIHASASHNVTVKHTSISLLPLFLKNGNPLPFSFVFDSFPVLLPRRSAVSAYQVLKVSIGASSACRSLIVLPPPSTLRSLCPSCREGPGPDADKPACTYSMDGGVSSVASA